VVVVVAVQVTALHNLEAWHVAPVAGVHAKPAVGVIGHTVPTVSAQGVVGYAPLATAVGCAVHWALAPTLKVVKTNNALSAIPTM